MFLVDRYVFYLMKSRFFHFFVFSVENRELPKLCLTLFGSRAILSTKEQSKSVNAKLQKRRNQFRKLIILTICQRVKVTRQIV